MAIEESTHLEGRSTAVGLARLAVGLLQGLALYLLYLAMDDKTWPAINGSAFAPLLFVAIFVPLAVLVSLGNLRLATLVVWSCLLAATVAGLAWYDIWRNEGVVSGGADDLERIVPTFALFFFTSAAAFIAQSLIAGGDADRRIMATYATHFDVAWKLALQLALSFLFVGIFWGIIALGAALFHLIGIDFFSRLIEHRWFAIPATTLALSAAIHLTDVRAGLVRGTRTLLLVLLSWLLPLMTIIGAGFLASLLATGLQPLWKTGFAAGYLLTAAGVLVILINAAYQDGDPARRPGSVLRWSASLAAFLLVPLVAISTYAVVLRVRQYGWTADRVASVACIVVATSYAIGYALAAWPAGAWFGRIPRCNFFTAILVLVVLGAIFSPVADPMRISVASQVARLKSGKVAPNQFDFNYLRLQSGRFGLAALRELASGMSGPAAIRSAAQSSLAAGTVSKVKAAPANIGANLMVYPQGQSLPASFLRQNWNGSDPLCLRQAGYSCDVYLLDLRGDGKIEIAIVGTRPGHGTYTNGLFEQDDKGVWRFVGRPDSSWSCDGVASALHSGKFGFIAPRWRDIAVAGQRLTIAPVDPFVTACPAQ